MFLKNRIYVFKVISVNAVILTSTISQTLILKTFGLHTKKLFFSHINISKIRKFYSDSYFARFTTYFFRDVSDSGIKVALLFCGLSP